MTVKWRSKATGTEFLVWDAFSGPSYGYRVSVILPDSDTRMILTYSELIEAFEKVEE